MSLYIIEKDGRDGASTPIHALTANDIGVSKMVKIKDSTNEIDNNIMQKIIADRVRHFSERINDEVRDACMEYHDKFESPIEKALFAAIVAINMDAQYGDELEIRFVHEKYRNIDAIKLLAEQSIIENNKINNLLNNPEHDTWRQYIDPYDAGLIKKCLFNQIKIDKYRIDFLIVKYCWSEKKHKYLAIECDGHDFHERTKEQAKKDRSKDRKLQELGFTVFRFTGSEIWADPMACANQIMDWI